MSLPNGAYNAFAIAYRDAGNEIGTFGGWGADLTAGNFVAQSTLFDTLVTATDAITLGNRTRNSYATDNIQTGAQPTNGAAREIKLLIQYRDVTTGEKMTSTVPTLDPTVPEYVLNANAKDVIIIPTDPGVLKTFVDAFEAFAINPRTGNAVEVYGLKVVGRNS